MHIKTFSILCFSNTLERPNPNITNNPVSAKTLIPNVNND